MKKLGHVHPRRTAPSLAALDASLSALEADVDKLDLAVPKLERVAVALGAFALGVAIDVLVTKIAQKTTQAVANKDSYGGCLRSAARARAAGGGGR